MKMIYGSHGRLVSRPCERCQGTGVITIKAAQEPTPDGQPPPQTKTTICPLCRGTRVKSTILRK